MTHDEAVVALPAYALGAFAGDVDALQRHLDSCQVCSAQLAQHLETTTRLAEAVPMLNPPARLRAAVLSDSAVLRAYRRYCLRSWRPIANSLLPLAAVLLLVVGLTGHSVQQQRQLDTTQVQLAIDASGLALLTSTETTVQRLEPVAALGTQAHGHWYHRPGIKTQVLVAEFLPPPPPGVAYFGWLLRANGSVEASGSFTLDSTGYGRLILLGHDGADVQEAIVTLQPVAGTGVPGQIALQWQAG